MTVQLKAAEDRNTSLQQILKSEIELRMQAQGTVCVRVIVYLSICVKRWLRIEKVQYSVSRVSSSMCRVMQSN